MRFMAVDVYKRQGFYYMGTNVSVNCNLKMNMSAQSTNLPTF